MRCKGALADLRQFLATENTLKIMKNDFYFTLDFFIMYKDDLANKQPTTKQANNCNTHIAQYLKE